MNDWPQLEIEASASKEAVVNQILTDLERAVFRLGEAVGYHVSGPAPATEGGPAASTSKVPPKAKTASA